MQPRTSAPVHFRDLPLGGFVERLASDEPVPGGGSASAVAASLGAALVAMVAELSKGRPKWAEHSETHEWAVATGQRLAERFLALADQDSEAYAAFGDALKLPRDSDDERHERTLAIREAAQTAAEVPLDCVESCLELVTVAEALAGRSNANASSDLNVASLLAEAAARGAAENVLVNVPSLGDEELAEKMTARVTALLADIERLARETREAVASGSSREPRAAAPGLAG